jgi:hypothetical protein
MSRKQEAGGTLTFQPRRRPDISRPTPVLSRSRLKRRAKDGKQKIWQKAITFILGRL